jgi:hypothetical protein
MKNKILTIFLLVFVLIPIKTNAASANIILTPNITSLTAGQNLTINISASATGANVDVIQFSGISYNTAILEMQNFSKAANCAFVFPPSNYLYSCGLSPVVGSSATNIATVTFKTKQSGSTSVSLSNIKAISGGVDVSIVGGAVSVNVSAPYVAPQKPGLVYVSSSTHLDENSWYPSGNLNLSWSKPAGVTDFSYVLDAKDLTVSPDSSLGGGISKEYSDLEEGVYYFHIKAKNAQGWGGTRHFRVNIDKTKPSDLSLIFEVGGSAIEPKNFAKFEAKDDLSGIQKYEISIDGAELIEATSPFEIPVTEGKKAKEVVVRAYDKAGNFIEKKELFTQKSVVVPRPEIVEISSLVKIIAKNNSLEREYFIKGNGSPYTVISIYINESFAGESEVDDNGNWVFFFNKPEGITNTVYAISTFGDLKSEQSKGITFSFDGSGALVLGDRTKNFSLIYVLIFIIPLVTYGALRNKKFKKFIHIKSLHQNH